MRALPLRKQDPEVSVETIGGQETAKAEDDTFDIPPKGASLERLRRWRQAVLVLNASRRFRYTLDLKQEEEKERIRRKFRAYTQVMRAALLFQDAGERNVPKTELPLLLEKARIRRVPKTELPVVLPRNYGIGEEQLIAMTRDHNYSALQDYGGVKGVANLLKTNVDGGITGDDNDLISRHIAFGSNTYHKKGKGFWSFLWEASQYLPLIILMVAAALCLGLGINTEGIKEGWYDGGSIAFAVCLIIVVTAISDYKQSLQFMHLAIDESSIDESSIEVIRNGKTISLSIFDLVVGDVVPLKTDHKVPADGLLISGEAYVIESSIKGGSKIDHKDQESPFLMAGWTVANGCGIMLVTAVGMNTKLGSEYMATNRDYNEETPLQVRQNIVATKIGKVGLAVAGAVLVVLLARYFTGKTTNADGTVQYIKGQTSVKSAIDGVIKIFTVAVTIVVVAVPKSLPLALSLTRVYSIRKMMADKGLVRRLSACETMGLVTTICSDKIGTLTLNQITVVEAYVGEKNIAGASNIVGSLSPTVNSLLLEGIAQNCTGSVYEPENSAVEITGSPTEKAILGWGVELKWRFNEVRSKSVIIRASPFNSEKKRGGVAVHAGGSDVHVHWKGAAEIVLDQCTSWMDASGTKHDMTPHAVEKFQKQIEAMVVKSLRCVALAYKPFDLKDVPNEDQRVNWSLPEDDLILLAIVGMKDPCHPGVKDAVLLCTNAGVKIRMVTGDNLQTAKGIALECGILSEKDKIDEVIVEGNVFHALSEDQKEQMVDKIKVMVKSSPIDKLQLVKALKKRDVVAVTGDDTYDIPALYEADVGLAMGIQGTMAAKVSSDIIILDDNFSSVVKLVRWGRSVYANIQKFIQFQLTVNVAALIIILVAAVSSGNVPLNAVQLLWVNLIMDTLGALALASEPPSDSLMKRPPVSLREPLITNIMWRNSLIQAFFQVAVLLSLNIKGRSLLQLNNHSAVKANEIKNTFIFNTFVLFQVFNEFNARKPEEFNIFEGVTKNHLFVGIIGVTIVLQAMIIEFLGKFTSTMKLSWQLWLVSIGIAFVSWPLAFLGKFIPVPQTPFKDLIRKCCPQRKKATGQRDEAVDSSLV